jgi:hypothetical protein
MPLTRFPNVCTRTLSPTILGAPIETAFTANSRCSEIPISERTVSRILQTLRRPPTQTWKTTRLAEWYRPISSSCHGHDEGAIRVHCSGTPSARSTAFQCDRASNRRVDIPVDCRRFCQSGCTEVSATRSGWPLRQRSSSAARVPKHQRVADGPRSPCRIAMSNA